MEGTERDLLIRIETKLDIFQNDLDRHIEQDDKRFDEVFGRVRILEGNIMKLIGGLAAIQLAATTVLKFWH